MVTSMTAFARSEDSGEWGHAVWEIRTVNHRYLDISIRLPENLRALETGVRERISTRLQRGKVECGLRYDTDAVADIQINTELMEKILHAARELPLAKPLSINPLDLMRWPGVIEQQTPEPEQIRDCVMTVLDHALEILLADRRREGEKIGQMIEQRCALSVRQIQQIRDKIPEIIDAVKERHLSRIRELGIEAENDRLEQEIALLAQKLDVAEELERLESHINEVRRILTEEKPAGRRLDFLMQEMNREANTLGAKSAHIDTSNASIELKVLIEQMREQIQNVE